MRVLAAFVPYVTVGIGLMVFHNAWLAILSYHAGMVAVMSLSRTRIAVGGSFRLNGYLIPVSAALAGACGGALLYILWPHMGLAGDISAFVRSIGLNERTWPAFLAYFILVNPLIEECYWRGHLASDSKWPGASDLMFSGYHLVVLAGRVNALWIIVAFAALAAAAWVWRRMNHLYGGLVVSTSSHLAADAAIILTVYYLTMR
jgi:hypothetical protein